MSVIEIEAVNKRLPTRFPPSLHQAMTEQEFQSIITDTNEVLEPGLKNVASKQCTVCCLVICSPCTAFLSCFGLCCAVPALTRASKEVRKNTQEALERHNSSLRPRGLQVAFKAHQAATMGGGVRNKVYIEVQCAYSLAQSGGAQPGYIPPAGSGFQGPPAGFQGPPAGAYASVPMGYQSAPLGAPPASMAPPTGVPVSYPMPGSAGYGSVPPPTQTYAQAAATSVPPAATTKPANLHL